MRIRESGERTSITESAHLQVKLVRGEQEISTDREEGGSSRPIETTKALLAKRRFSRLPPLGLLRAFDAVGRCGSFTLAAEELGVTQSAVSQQIRHLEEFLEVRLFRRLPRRIELTRDGAVLATVVQEALVMIEQACVRLINPHLPAVICVNAPPGFASRWLIPRLRYFMEINQNVKVTLLSSTDAVDFDRQDIDIAIRWGRGTWVKVRSEALTSGPIFPVCSPDLLRQSGPLKTAADCARYTLLQTINGIPWRAWSEASGFVGAAFADTLYFSEADLMLVAAAQGQGICLANLLLVGNDLLSGRLARASDINTEVEDSYYVLSSTEYGDKPVIASFRRWIRNEAERELAHYGPA